jgi:hypothetical protein
MKNISREIYKRLKAEQGHGLIDVICELVEGSDLIDYADVADVIKANPTMLAVLEKEFEKRRMIPAGDAEINLTDIFKEL